MSAGPPPRLRPTLQHRTLSAPESAAAPPCARPRLRSSPDGAVIVEEDEHGEPLRWSPPPPGLLGYPGESLGSDPRSLAAGALEDGESGMYADEDSGVAGLMPHHPPSMPDTPISPTTVTPSVPPPHARDASGCINLAIVGAPGSGKSVFIQHTLDLRAPPTSRLSAKKMSLEGRVFQVRLLEVPLSKIAFDDRGGGLLWPQRLSADIDMPPVHGVLALFDSSDLRSVSLAKRLFFALPRLDIPFIVVACQCDRPPQSDSATFDVARRVLGPIKVHQTALGEPDSHKKCISTVLSCIVSPVEHVAALSPTSVDLQAHARARQHARALSESRPTPGQSLASTRASIAVDTQARNARSNSQPGPARAVPGQHRLISSFQHHPSDVSSPQLPPISSQSSNPPNTPPPSISSWRHSTTSSVFNTFLDMDDEVDDVATTPPLSEPSGQPAPPAPIAGSGSRLGKDRGSIGTASSGSSGGGGNINHGMTFDQLVDRLIAVPSNQQDVRFPIIFLTLYRKFSTPWRLLSALIARFDAFITNGTVLLLRYANQLRIINVLAQWLTDYPGDFASPRMRKRMSDFIAAIDKNFVFFFSTKELSSRLDSISADDDYDRSWACSDHDMAVAAAAAAAASGPAVVPAISSTTAAAVATGASSSAPGRPGSIDTFLDASAPPSPSVYATILPDEPPPLAMSALDLGDDPNDVSSGLSVYSTVAPSSIYRSDTASTTSYVTLQSVESSQQLARHLELNPSVPMTKERWKVLMDIPDEDVAREITRMDYIMYGSFLPREMVRHVSTPMHLRERAKGLENVNRMIAVFNHLAFLVASMILFRDKAKHRAMALEKWINVASKLRQMNNYNSLGSIVAGLNRTPIFRLSQTKELLSQSVQRQFMSLVILMGTQKSYFAYRLAWNNSSSERIAFLPLHLRDLVSAEEGNKTHIDVELDSSGNPNGSSTSSIGTNSTGASTGANNHNATPHGGPTVPRERLLNWRKFEIMGDALMQVHTSQISPSPRLSHSEIAQNLLLRTACITSEEEMFARSLAVEPMAAGGAGDHGARKRFGFRRT